MKRDYLTYRPVATLRNYPTYPGVTISDTIRTRLMRLILRYLLRASELGAAILGFFLAPAFVTALWRDRPAELVAPLLAVCGSWMLPVFALIFFRRRTRAWKINYDAACWQRIQAERKMHPVRAQYRRLAGRILIYLPSALAAFVLLFFPIVTHIAHPGSQYFGRYHIPIPWKFAAFQVEFPGEYAWVQVLLNSTAKGRFGMTPFPLPPIWRAAPVSLVGFGYTSKVDALRVGTGIREATEVTIREFGWDDVVLTCLQYRPGLNDLPHVRPWAAATWDVDCRTTAHSRDQSFRAFFQGRAEDTPAFYEIVKGVRAVQ